MQRLTRKLKHALPSVTLLALMVGLWWWVVLATESLIFPTPGQVVTGTLELAEVTPARMATQALKPGDYRLAFRFMGGL